MWAALVAVLVGTTASADAAVAYRSKTCNQLEDVASLALTKPAGTASGDLLLATVGYATTATASAPAGWTQVPGLRGSVAGTHQLVTWYKIAGSAEPGSYAFTAGSAADAISGSLTAFTGVSGNAPIAGTPGQTIHSALASTFPLPDSDGVRAGSMRLSSISHDDVGDSTYSGGMTELCDNNTTNGADLSFSAAFEPTGIGTTAARTVTLTDNGHAVLHTVVLNAALPPSTDAISPAVGPTAGGTTITITGSDFTGATGVTFDGVPAAAFTVVDDSTIVVTVPPGAAGPADVRITTTAGTSVDAGAADDYTYYAPPTVTAVAPNAGPLAGGTTVTITGTNFGGLSGAAAVRFGATNATSYTVVNATTITAIVPAGTGTQSVRVTTPGGTTADVAADDYTYFAIPTITAISPTQGPTAGGTAVTITGTNLTGTTAVLFGATSATAFTVVSATTITATAPAGTGTQDVRATTPGGTTANTAADNFSYFALPTITGITPAQGPEAGGTTVTITGTNFASLSGAAAVRFGATNAASYTVVNATTITAVAPAGTGTQDVRVTTPGGTTANTAADNYTYFGIPTITALSPNQGPTAGATTVTITGTNLTGTTAVLFGATSATAFTVVSATTITATAPAGTGTQDVRATTPGGTTANSAADNYTYFALPNVTAISPTRGPEVGGTTVTITGTGFAGLTGAAAVQFGTTNATSYTVLSATSITAVAPAGTGVRDIRVTTPGGTTANTAADDYTYVPAPTVTALAPVSGPVAGGTTVTITGTNLTGATAVVFGATAASAYTVVSATTITATAPAGAGIQDVRVTTPGGQSANTAADNYTYFALPTITAIAPAQGPASGGTTVTITGTNFTGATAVKFGTTDAAAFIVASATTITATAPGGTGIQDVRVTTPGGTTANTAADNYTYVPLPTITSISPVAGPVAGGTSVTITGTNLTAASAVVFGATAATSYTVVSATTITAVAPAGTGTQDIRVTTVGGTSANTAADDYTYFAIPTITALAPVQGPAVGGTTVTITGTNLTGASAVLFGATAATAFTVVSATTISAAAPAGTGAQDVRVTTPGGTTANTAADNYTYVPAPTITAISPAAGPVAGGTSVTITGTNFTGATQVRFGATDAASFTVVSATSITAVAPAGTGTQDVRVTTAGGTSANSAADDYAYFALPAVTALAPAQGPLIGGTTVTITGTGFTGLSGAAAVQFGTTNATSYTVVSATSITAVAPAGTGTQDIRVTTPGGTSANTAADDYTYVPLPTVTALAPAAGPLAGGNTVTITGTGFTGTSAVAFGTTAATSYTVVSATSITAVAPAGTGTQDVRVTTAGGQSANTAADNYAYVAIPTITALGPAQGPTAGGTSVTITGTNLAGATAVVFGTSAATTFTVVSATTITATAPAGTGTQDVRVTTPGGTTANTAADNFVYVAPPTVTAISPAAGPLAGGTVVTISGTNLSGVTAVVFGATAATGFTVVSATTITATAPAGTGTQDVRVTTPGGTTANSAADDYTYVAAPTLTSISPAVGPAAGGTSVTITGTNLTGATQVVFGAAAATAFTVVSATTITATAPAGTGTQDIRVTTPGGTTANTAADDFTYFVLPTITAITPAQGPLAGGTTVTITGTGFAGLSGAAAVRFGATNATSYTVVSATTITAVAPAGSGIQDLRVTTPGGTTANTAADDYTYTPLPAVTGLAPAAGPLAGGTTITITGANLTGATAVMFGATPATSFAVVNATTITAVAPAGSGTQDVRVTTPGGQSANTAADNYAYFGLPSITAIAPAQGPTSGGTTVTITGTNLAGATAVKFGTTDAAAFVVASATTITATAPGGSGTQDIRITTPGGTTANTAADDYTYVAAPTVTAISPAAGPVAGGASVTITGTNLTGATQVVFGAAAATAFTVVSATTITATAPAGTGTQDIRVTTAGGLSANTAADDYTYVPLPTITALSPNQGPVAGGTSVTITGTGFTGLSGAAAVRFGTTNATSYTVVSATTITAIAPAGTGTQDIRVTTPGGTTANTAADDYAYFATPAVTGIWPTTGPTAGGGTVTITGTGLLGTTQVRFGTTDATGFTIVNATTITASVPPHAAGSVDIRVTGPGGQSANVAADDYTYVDLPTITGISPSSGPATGATTVTISGAFLTGATSVTFGGTAATGFTVVNATTITATAPAHAAGLVDVRVTTPSGVSANTAADDFTYIGPPAISSIAPSQGPDAGGTTVTLTGTSFTGATAVVFGATPALGYTVVNATTITATAPAHAAGTVDVRITTPAGTSANTAADDFLYIAACSAGALSLTPSDVLFAPFTIDGLDKVRTTTSTVGVADMTGAGAGWKLELGTEQFSAGSGKVLPLDAAQITDANATPLGGNCSAPTRALSTYPVPLPISPSKERVYSAAAGTGRGPVDVTLDVALHVPGNVQPGTYVSTWTYDLTASP